LKYEAFGVDAALTITNQGDPGGQPFTACGLLLSGAQYLADH